MCLSLDDGTLAYNQCPRQLADTSLGGVVLVPRPYPEVSSPWNARLHVDMVSKATVDDDVMSVHVDDDVICRTCG